jgi:hypothetical protein
LSTVGVEQAGGRRRYALAGVALLAVAPVIVAAQARVVERHAVSEPEGRLLAFYAAAVAYTPAGFLTGGAATLGLELSYIPWLDASRRRPFADKPEATNLAPVFGRPRLAVRLPGHVMAEASWIPPVRVFDVRANLVAIALSRAVASVGAVTLAPRLWATAGRVRGAMTCSEDTMLGQGLELQTYYVTVCHGRESDDWFEPRLLGGELLARRALTHGVEAYLVGGARYDRTRFDIGVLRADGTRDPDHPILELSSTRPHFALGAVWERAARFGAGLEAFYAPGSLFTVRASGRWTWRP